MSNRNWELPNPFIRPDGSLMQAGEGWDAQRSYLRGILEEDLYGKAPEFTGKICSVTEFSKEVWEGKGRFSVERLYLVDDCDAEYTPEELAASDLVSFKIAVSLPIMDKPCIPIVLNAGFVEEELAKIAADNGFAVITYDFMEIAPDGWSFKDAALAKKYPDYDWMLIRMWAWLQSRTIDWVIKQPCFDSAKVVAAGHSRYGKTSLCCGVFDPRVAVCVAAGSGCGGIGSLRRAGGRYGENTGYVETLGWLMKDNNLDYWFNNELKQYGTDELNGHNRENEMRFDANFIGSAIAPTPLLILEGLDDNWANPFGTQLSWNAVSEVYHYLGLDDKLGIHFREGGHAFNYEDWTVMIDFCRHHFYGEPQTTPYKTRQIRDFRAGHSWQNPLDYGKEDITYPEISALDLQQYMSRKEERWAFGEAKFGKSMQEMLAIYFGPDAVK